MSAACRELRPLIGAAILGGLDPEEAAAVREHVAACPGCAAEHSRLAPLPGLLTLAAGAEAVALDPPSPALEERLLDAVAREAPPRRRRRRPRPRRLVLVGAGGAALAAAAVMAVLLVSGGDAPGHGYPLALTASPAAPAARGRAELRAVAGGTALHLWVKGLPADRRTVYEVHCDAGSWSASAGTFRVDADGGAYVQLTTAARQGEYDAIRVLERVPGGRPRLVLWASLPATGEPGRAAPRTPS
ncbi:MAG: hypothetical protein QOF17_83 [Solirubrobacteraceae bacterium]|jgi:anti-sigma factor RsiW|nr:hypothetical protein [Solirubrobacteraceae bacterium]